MDKRLLEKYFNNNCTPKELSLVLSWFRDLKNTIACKDSLSQIWEELSEDDFSTETDFDSILNKIHHKINTQQTNLLMEKAGKDLVRYDRRQYFLLFLKNVAAILIFPLIGLSLFMSVKYYSARNNQILTVETYNEVFSSVDAITKVNLPDGSTVWLNHRSSLRYPALFVGDYRQVELKGEGYFEITHNPKIPFVVNTNNFQVLAHGTTFNIMAYPDEDKIETSLIEGKVELRKSLPSGKMETLYIMNPDDISVYDIKNDQIHVGKIKNDRYFSWKDGRLIFTGESLDQVIKKLSRWFNVDIQIKNTELNNLTLTATFINETLDQVLELLSHVTPISYSVSDREISSDGTFTKRKVLLYYLKQ
ncbi:MAG: FecR family protein [Enterococcus sp.]|nr:FecR family protein [Enterococcus sp.]